MPRSLREKRDKLIRLRVTESEHSLFFALAERQRITVSDFLRIAAIESIPEGQLRQFQSTA